MRLTAFLGLIMPQGSPGMEGARKVPHEVVLFDHRGHTRAFAAYWKEKER